MSNTITAYFKGRVGVAESVYQYDYGKILIIDGLNLPATFEVHFTTVSEDDAITVIGQNSRVAIPDSCISIPGTVTAYIYLHTGENDGETEYVIKFAVIRRARPDYDEDEKSNWESAASQALAMLQNSKKVNTPLDEYNQVDNGTAGQLLRTKGDGSTEWVNEGLPTDEQTAAAVSAWLDEHPEATTTVEDGSLTEAKLANALKLKVLKDYVTPEMFGAIGDGETDDTTAVKDAIDYCCTNKLPLFGIEGKTYIVKETITIRDPIYINLNNATLLYGGDSSITDFINYGINSVGGVKGYGTGIVNGVINGNSKCDNVLHISGGKNICLEWLRVEAPSVCAILIDASYKQNWELSCRNVAAIATNTSESGQAQYAMKVANITDSFFENVICVNGSKAWMYFNASTSIIRNFHGYSYPNTLHVEIGLHVLQAGNIFDGVTIDTPYELGIKNESTRNIFSNIVVVNFTGGSGNRVAIEDNDYNEYNGIRCDGDCDLIIKTHCVNFLNVSNILNYTAPAKDITFTENKFPWKMKYDRSSRATIQCIGGLSSFDNYMNQVTHTVTITFPTPFRTKWDYDVIVEQLTPTDPTAPPMGYFITRGTDSVVVDFNSNTDSYIRANVFVVPKW